MSTAPYYILKHGPWARPALVTLALQHPYSLSSDAIADMGEGVVFDSQGVIVAFHERHADLVTHLGARITYYLVGRDLGRVSTAGVGRTDGGTL